MMDLINPVDTGQLRETVKNAQPYPFFCIDNFLKEEFAEEVYNAFPSYQDAQKMGREFSAVNEKKKVQITDATKFPPPIAKLHQLLASAEFLDMISKAMNIPNLLADPDMEGGGIHETNSGGHLDVHIDFNLHEKTKWHRRINILIYFNKDWKEEYGGYFDMWDKEVKKCYGAFAPLFNRVVVFETSNISFHGVRPLTCPPDVMRKSFAAYYYTKEPPAHWDGKSHSTIFKPRPEEWLKGSVLMPAESAMRSTNDIIKKAKRAIKKLIS